MRRHTARFRGFFDRIGVIRGEQPLIRARASEKRSFSGTLLGRKRVQSQAARTEETLNLQGVILFAASLQKVLFSTLFNMGDSAAYVCGKLPSQKFQIGEAENTPVRKASKNKFLPSTFFWKKEKIPLFLPKSFQHPPGRIQQV